MNTPLEACNNYFEGKILFLVGYLIIYIPKGTSTFDEIRPF